MKKAVCHSEDDKLLEGMIDQMNKTTAQASAAIDEALAFVDASNKRIATMERKDDHRQHHLAFERSAPSRA